MAEENRKQILYDSFCAQLKENVKKIEKILYSCFRAQLKWVP